MKKTICCLLVIVILISAYCQTTAFALDEPTFTVSNESGECGQSVTISIGIKNNPGVASIKLKIRFDSDLVLTSIVYNTALGGDSQQPQKMTSPVTLNWFNGSENTTGDMVYATLCFQISENAVLGNHPVTISYEEDDVFNIAEKNVEFQIVNGFVTVCENIGNNVEHDINGDGQLDASDLTALARHVAKIEMITDAARHLAADVNGDGTIDASDLTHLARYIAKIIDSL